MSIDFYEHLDRCTLWPVMVVMRGENEESGEPAGLMIAVDFLFWTVGLQF